MVNPWQCDNASASYMDRVRFAFGNVFTRVGHQRQTTVFSSPGLPCVLVQDTLVIAFRPGEAEPSSDLLWNLETV